MSRLLADAAIVALWSTLVWLAVRGPLARSRARKAEVDRLARIDCRPVSRINQVRRPDPSPRRRQRAS